MESRLAYHVRRIVVGPCAGDHKGRPYKKALINPTWTEY
jgi:hypothetical protein